MTVSTVSLFEPVDSFISRFKDESVLHDNNTNRDADVNTSSESSQLQ